MTDYKFENINIAFGSDVIYKDFSIEFEKNKITTILGRSGCGKTTLLNYIMKDILKYEDLSCVFQEESLVEWLTVRENIDIILRNKKISKAEKEEIILKNLKLVNLNGYENYYPAKLSGGMKQRVNIARAVSYSSDLLFMDEPFKSIDIINKAEIIKKLKIEIKKRSQTTIMVSHDLDEAIDFSDNIICISGGIEKK
ncbi:ATP-binding cassette domain-containing protein [Sebaldella sp. S0638]|uniref:ATP-binding cassette domain-containing protein n=1 Tax=Sebaldella sp. S0638 TaxID=2957809 RepID=UPI00209ED404|nr:ATP-binding cassette domain-containing protein [Sebaldella sp. S0638]MCP1224038.1 ATP-binding cassette domain-containing protein [Sebaldella sp. S0638]